MIYTMKYADTDKSESEDKLIYPDNSTYLVCRAQLKGLLGKSQRSKINYVYLSDKPFKNAVKVGVYPCEYSQMTDTFDFSSEHLPFGVFRTIRCPEIINFLNNHVTIYLAASYRKRELS